VTEIFTFGQAVTERFTPDCSFHEKSWLKNRVNSGTPYPQAIGAGEEIVQAQKKFWEYL